jgi:hypothetical protein
MIKTMMPHKYWETGFLLVLFALYGLGVWYGISKAAASGWKWTYCVIAGALIIAAGGWLAWFLRSMRRVN